MERLLTPATVARMGGVSRGTVNNRMKSGQLAYVTVDGARRIPEAVAVAWAGKPVPASAVHGARQPGQGFNRPRPLRTARFRVYAKGSYALHAAPILYTCRDVETARLMAANAGVPTRIATAWA